MILLFLGFGVFAEAQLLKRQGEISREAVMKKEVFDLPDFAVMDWEEMIAFFGEGERESYFDDEGFVTRFPENLKALNSKEAALAYARANQRDGHENMYPLKVGDSKGVPTKGWLVYEQNTASCYTYVEELWALSLEERVLVYCSNSRNGVVGSNPLLDDVGYDIRVIQLKKDEAEFLGGMLWWLNRIESKKEGGSLGVTFSTGDGSCSLRWFDRGVMKNFYEQRRWWMGVSTRWEGGYDQGIAGNLAGDFLDRYLPKYLGERWSSYGRMEHRNLTTGDGKLEERHSEGAVRVIRDGIAKVFAMHGRVVAPPEVLGWLARASGDLGLREFSEELAGVSKSLKEKSKERIEYEKLREDLLREIRPMAFGRELNEEEKGLRERFDRMVALKKKVGAEEDFGLRGRLEVAQKQIKAAYDPDALKRLGAEAGDLQFWAQQQLRKRFPELYGEVLLANVREARDVLLKEQAIDLLVDFAPKLGVELVNGMSEEEKAFYCLSLIDLYPEFFPEQMGEMLGWVLKKARDRDAGWEHRHKAAKLLTPKWFPEDEVKIYGALKEIFYEKKKVDGDSFDPSPRVVCFGSLVRWPAARKDWQGLRGMLLGSDLLSWDDQEMFDSLMRLVRFQGEEANEEMRLLLESRMMNGAGMIESLVFDLFEHDYRKSSELLGHLATGSKKDVESQWGTSSQANLKPLGRYRYHAARKVRAIWMEEDERVRARMMAALALGEPMVFVEYGEDRKLVGKRAVVRLRGLLKKYPEVEAEFRKRVGVCDGDYREALVRIGELLE